MALTNSVPELSPLPPDLRWLLDLDMTAEALHGYLYRTAIPPNVPPGAPEGVDTWFTVSNVFASPPGAYSMQSRYDLIPNGLLADADDRDLDPEPPEEIDEDWFPEGERQRVAQRQKDIRDACWHLYDAWSRADRI